jgi:hypothetical protein
MIATCGAMGGAFGRGQSIHGSADTEAPSRVAGSQIEGVEGIGETPHEEK